MRSIGICSALNVGQHIVFFENVIAFFENVIACFENVIACLENVIGFCQDAFRHVLLLVGFVIGVQQNARLYLNFALACNKDN